MTEATTSVAFLSDDTGEDVAVLERLTDELFDSHAPLNGEEWQAMVNLVAAAGELLAALRQANDELIDLYEEAYPDDESDNSVTAAIDRAIRAIKKAEGRGE
jgi:hypothetical protein